MWSPAGFGARPPGDPGKGPAMTPGRLCLFIGVCTGLAVVLLADGGLYLAGGYQVAGSALLSGGVVFAVGAAFFIRQYLQIRRHQS